MTIYYCSQSYYHLPTTSNAHHPHGGLVPPQQKTMHMADRI